MLGLQLNHQHAFEIKGENVIHNFMVQMAYTEFFYGQNELEYLFFLSRKALFFFSEFNIKLYDKNSESDYFFFLHQNQNIFFSDIGNQNIFLEKNIRPPPFKLNGRSLKYGVFNLCHHYEISYSRYANKHYITGVYIAINDIYR